MAVLHTDLFAASTAEPRQRSAPKKTIIVVTVKGKKMENKELNDECVMPDYKVMCEKANCEANYWREQHRELMGEVIYLRGVKHTVEAFLGREIGDGKS